MKTTGTALLFTRETLCSQALADILAPLPLRLEERAPEDDDWAQLAGEPPSLLVVDLGLSSPDGPPSAGCSPTRRPGSP